MSFVYKTVQIPPNIQMNTRETGQEASTYLQTVLNQYASEGWEFQSVETIGVSVKPGCFESLKGTKESFTHYYVIVFRREVA
ncbi:DUF4177 domain-containing protein [Proteus penneri]|uniref:DUF4177 domain-containing protein n=1 Tax=Proteus penneri TaxID=102862 RepID=UPI0034D3BEDB